MGRLEGKIALITGGTSGIGLATARAFIREGAFVFVTGRNRERLDRALSELGPSALGQPCDSSSIEQLDELYRAISEKKGRLDILFASAGHGETAELGEISGDQFDRIFDLNVRGTLFTVQKALPLMPDGSAIVLNASMVATKAFPSSSVYSASKAAVRSFARTWSIDLKKRRIRVNAVSPGTIDTDAIAGIPESGLEYFRRLIPRGVIGQAEEVAEAVLFLASDEASFITGVNLPVDGGVTQI